MMVEEHKNKNADNVAALLALSTRKTQINIECLPDWQFNGHLAVYPWFRTNTVGFVVIASKWTGV